MRVTLAPAVMEGATAVLRATGRWTQLMEKELLHRRHLTPQGHPEFQEQINKKSMDQS